MWRRGWDSNPRPRFLRGHDFQSCSFGQLGHLSVFAIRFWLSAVRKARELAQLARLPDSTSQIGIHLFLWGSRFQRDSFGQLGHLSVFAIRFWLSAVRIRLLAEIRDSLNDSQDLGRSQAFFLVGPRDGNCGGPGVSLNTPWEDPRAARS